MERLGVRRSRVKPALASAGERLGRLKPNGQLTGYSPLSRLIELPGLAERAGAQRETIDELHRNAAIRALRPG